MSDSTGKKIKAIYTLILDRNREIEHPKYLTIYNNSTIFLLRNCVCSVYSLIINHIKHTVVWIIGMKQKIMHQSDYKGDRFRFQLHR